MDHPREPDAAGPDRRRGRFRVGEQVQLTDPKGRRHTITLEPGKRFHTHRGHIRHDDLIDAPDGSVVTHSSGTEYLALRPLLSDYVMSMPRGAQVIYPKDAGPIVTMVDVYPGANVVEAGVGSGALSLSLLRAVGEGGTLHSFERRAEFADIARANARMFFGKDHPAWQITIGDLQEALPRVVADGSVDRVVLDMLAPWDCLQAVFQALAPGGVLICYVATTTQLSRVAESARTHGGFTEPLAWESMERQWHLEGLAVRPEHRMHGHTGFLIRMRTLAPGVRTPQQSRRPAAAAYGADYQDQLAAQGDWTPSDLGERSISDKRLRRKHRDVLAASGQAATDTPAPLDEPSGPASSVEE
ncbi:MAG: tRNA (adenine-N1)-methyltransferase [Ornithinimicrobium sp.]